MSGRSPVENTQTGQNRIVRKKGDLTGAGKGDWRRGSNLDPNWRKNYDRIFNKKADKE